QADEEVRTPGGRNREGHGDVRERGEDRRGGVQAEKPAAGKAPPREDPDEEKGRRRHQVRGREGLDDLPLGQGIEAEPHEKEGARGQKRGAPEESEALREEVALGRRTGGSEGARLGAGGPGSPDAGEGRARFLAPRIGRRPIGGKEDRGFGVAQVGTSVGELDQIRRPRNRGWRITSRRAAPWA